MHDLGHQNIKVEHIPNPKNAKLNSTSLAFRDDRQIYWGNVVACYPNRNAAVESGGWAAVAPGSERAAARVPGGEGGADWRAARGGFGANECAH